MSATDESSLELLRRLAPSIPVSDRERYAEIYKLLANPSPQLWNEREFTQHDDRLQRAYSDLHQLLLRLSSEFSGNDMIEELQKRYQHKAADD